MQTYVYERVSTEEQKKSRNGLEAQRSNNLGYCDRLGLALSHEPLVDAGISGGVPLHERPDGARLVGLIKAAHAAGEAVAVVSSDSERLFRSVADHIATTELWRETGVSLHLSTEGGEIDLEDADAWGMRMMKAVWSEWERRKGAKRTKAALGALRKRGLKIGPAPYGYSNVVEFNTAGERTARGRHAVDASEHAVVERMRMLAAQHGHKATLIAEVLNREGFRTRHDRPWTKFHVSRILGREKWSANA